MAQITQIQVRRDTAATWANVSKNPVLAQGEIGLETDTGKFKIGDGTTAWNSLTYATDGSKLTGTITASTTTGNAATATKLATARQINGQNFDGTADITVTAAAGTLTGSTLNSTVTGSSLTSVGTIGTGTWQGSVIDPTYGGSLIVGHSQLNTTYTKVTNDTTPEAVFRNSSGTIQYFNVAADTTYFFEGFIQMTKTTTAAVVDTSILYYSGSSGTTPLTEQAARLSVQYMGTAALIGVGSQNATATGAVSSSTALANVYAYFKGFIRTHATTAGRINIAQWVETAGATAPQWLPGSYINIYKVGSGNAGTFGTWS